MPSAQGTCRNVSSSRFDSTARISTGIRRRGRYHMEAFAAAPLAWYAKRLSLWKLNGLSRHRPPPEDRFPHARGAQRARACAGEGLGGREGLREAPGEERARREVRLPRWPALR